MSDPLGAPNRFLSLRVLSGGNIPVGSGGKGIGSCVKVFLVGPIRSYLTQTNRIKSANPEWKTGVMSFNPVRGLRIHFEIWNDCGAKDRCVASGDFDPHYNFMKSSGDPTRVELHCFEDTQPDPESPSFLLIYVALTVKAIATQLPPQKPLIKPFYITFDPENAIRLTPPYDHYTTNEGVKGFLPYRFSYELSVVLFNEKNKIYDFVGCSNREVIGAWHSGCNMCGSYSSLSPSIRLDPVELGKAGYKYVFIMVSTNDLTTLKSQLQIDPVSAPQDKYADAIITIWQSQEVNGAFSRSKVHKLDTKALQDLKPVGQFPLLPNQHANSAIVAIGTIAMNPVQLTFTPAKYFVPNDALKVTTQNPSEIIPLICKELKFAEDNTKSLDIQIPVIQFPLFVPRSLNRLFKLKKGPNILARATACRSHVFAAFAFDSEVNHMITCSQGSPYQLNGALRFLQGNIAADLANIPNDISYIAFAIYGQDMLCTDLVNKQSKTDPANMLVIYLNQKEELLKTSYKFSHTKNSLLWFALFRDAFGGWGIVNFRRGALVDDSNHCCQICGNFIKTILKV